MMNEEREDCCPSRDSLPFGLQADNMLHALRVSIPCPMFEKDKWAQLRQRKVESLADIWEREPNLVKVLSDAKLGSNQMVLLPKEMFESMLRILKDLQEGQLGIGMEMQMIGEHVALVSKLVDEKIKEEDSLKQAVRVLGKLMTRTTSSLFAYSRGKEVKSTPLSEEEKKLLAEDEA